MKDDIYRNCAAAILAGGESLRMGEDKAYLAWEGKTFLEHIAGELGTFPVLFVSLGAEGDSAEGPEGQIQEGQIPSGQVPAGQVPEGWVPVRDRYAGAGPMAGIAAVLEESPLPWVFVVSCDMPRMNPSVAEALWEKVSEGTDLVVPHAPDGRRHMTCALWNRSALPHLLRRLAEGDFRLYTLCGELHTACVPVNDRIAAAVENVNTPEAYRRLKGTGD